jgi:hypothetical protein
VIVLLALSACAASADESHWFNAMVDAPRGEGVARTYAASYKRTLDAARQSLLDQRELRYSELNRSGLVFRDLPRDTANNGVARISGYPIDTTVWSLYANSDMGRGWDGSQVRIVIDSIGPNQTTVRVLSKLRTASIVGRRGDYSGLILDEIGHLLK